MHIRRNSRINMTSISLTQVVPVPITILGNSECEMLGYGVQDSIPPKTDQLSFPTVQDYQSMKERLFQQLRHAGVVDEAGLLTHATDHIPLKKVNKFLERLKSTTLTINTKLGWLQINCCQLLDGWRRAANNSKATMDAYYYLIDHPGSSDEELQKTFAQLWDEESQKTILSLLHQSATSETWYLPHPHLKFATTFVVESGCSVGKVQKKLIQRFYHLLSQFFYLNTFAGSMIQTDDDEEATFRAPQANFQRKDWGLTTEMRFAVEGLINRIYRALSKSSDLSVTLHEEEPSFVKIKISNCPIELELTCYLSYHELPIDEIHPYSPFFNLPLNWKEAPIQAFLNGKRSLQAMCDRLLGFSPHSRCDSSKTWPCMARDSTQGLRLANAIPIHLQTKKTFEEFKSIFLENTDYLELLLAAFNVAPLLGEEREVFFEEVKAWLRSQAIPKHKKELVYDCFMHFSRESMTSLFYLLAIWSSRFKPLSIETFAGSPKIRFQLKSHQKTVYMWLPLHVPLDHLTHIYKNERMDLVKRLFNAFFRSEEEIKDLRILSESHQQIIFPEEIEKQIQAFGRLENTPGKAFFVAILEYLYRQFHPNSNFHYSFLECIPHFLSNFPQPRSAVLGWLEQLLNTACFSKLNSTPFTWSNREALSLQSCSFGDFNEAWILSLLKCSLKEMQTAGKKLFTINTWKEQEKLALICKLSISNGNLAEELFDQVCQSSQEPSCIEKYLQEHNLNKPSFITILKKYHKTLPESKVPATPPQQEEEKTTPESKLQENSDENKLPKKTDEDKLPKQREISLQEMNVRELLAEEEKLMQSLQRKHIPLRKTFEELLQSCLYHSTQEISTEEQELLKNALKRLFDNTRSLFSAQQAKELIAFRLKFVNEILAKPSPITADLLVYCMALPSDSELFCRISETIFTAVFSNENPDNKLKTALVLHLSDLTENYFSQQKSKNKKNRKINKYLVSKVLPKYWSLAMSERVALPGLFVVAETHHYPPGWQALLAAAYQNKNEEFIEKTYYYCLENFEFTVPEHKAAFFRQFFEYNGRLINYLKKPHLLAREIFNLCCEQNGIDEESLAVANEKPAPWRKLNEFDFIAFKALKFCKIKDVKFFNEIYEKLSILIELIPDNVYEHFPKCRVKTYPNMRKMARCAYFASDFMFNNPISFDVATLWNMIEKWVRFFNLGHASGAINSMIKFSNNSSTEKDSAVIAKNCMLIQKILEGGSKSTNTIQIEQCETAIKTIRSLKGGPYLNQIPADFLTKQEFYLWRQKLSIHSKWELVEEIEKIKEKKKIAFQSDVKNFLNAYEMKFLDFFKEILQFIKDKVETECLSALKLFNDASMNYFIAVNLNYEKNIELFQKRAQEFWNKHKELVKTLQEAGKTHPALAQCVNPYIIDLVKKMILFYEEYNEKYLKSSCYLIKQALAWIPNFLELPEKEREQLEVFTWTEHILLMEIDEELKIKPTLFRFLQKLYEKEYMERGLSKTMISTYLQVPTSKNLTDYPFEHNQIDEILDAIERYTKKVSTLGPDAETWCRICMEALSPVFLYMPGPMPETPFKNLSLENENRIVRQSLIILKSLFSEISQRPEKKVFIEDELMLLCEILQRLQKNFFARLNEFGAQKHKNTLKEFVNAFLINILQVNLSKELIVNISTTNTLKLNSFKSIVGLFDICCDLIFDDEEVLDSEAVTFFRQILEHLFFFSGLFAKCNFISFQTEDAFEVLLDKWEKREPFREMIKLQREGWNKAKIKIHRQHLACNYKVNERYSSEVEKMASEIRAHYRALLANKGSGASFVLQYSAP